MATRRTGSRNTLLDIVGVPFAKEVIARNVALIKTIHPTMLPKLEKRILGFFARAYTQDEIADWIMERCGVTSARASLIAGDQIAKASEELRVEKFKRQGYKFLIWHHGSAQDPRKHHVTRWDGHTGKRSGRPNGLDGFVFSIDDPPVIDAKTGERGLPGHLIGCTCWLEPVDLTGLATRRHRARSYGIFAETAHRRPLRSELQKKIAKYLRMVN